MIGIKHLIECHCYLKIYKKENTFINHKFLVYSKVNEFDKIEEKIVKCNNCGTLHKVIGVNNSEIFAGKEESTIVKSIKDVEILLPKKIVEVLKSNKKDIADYEHVSDIIKNKAWGDIVVLRREIIGEKQQVKFLKINSETDFEILNEEINDTIIF